VNKFQDDHWHKIVSAFVSLFDRTTANQLFTAVSSTSNTAEIAEDDETPSTGQERSPKERGAEEDLSLSAESPVRASPKGKEKANGVTSPQEVVESKDSPTGPLSPPSVQTTTEAELEDYRPAATTQQQPVVVTAAKRRLFNRIITRCILQLLMIETVNELFLNHSVYARIPSPELLRLMTMLKKSYHFAKRFNNDKDLRMRLFKEGFMKQPPNLLKQESGSAATYISILVRMYFDEGEERRKNRPQIEAALIP
jgi:brefeldin A-inhibited guanine nucleotide-exchange protein